MTDKIDNDSNSQKTNRTAEQLRKNVRMRNQKDIKETSQATSDTTELQFTPNKNPDDIPINNNVDSEIADISDTQNTTDTPTTIKNDPTVSKPYTPTRESLKDKQFINRKKRRERNEKRKQELLASAMSKLKAFDGNNNSDSLKNLGDVISQKTSPENPFTNIETSVSQQEILANAQPQKPAQSEAPKAQSAKDRFKNALKKVTLAAKAEISSDNAVPETPQDVAFKHKIEERKRIKKTVTHYLEQMGLSYPQGNFQHLCNTITDVLLLNIEATLPKYRTRIEKLQSRADLAIRSGNNVLNLNLKKSKAESIVGDLFSRYDIDKNKDKIIVQSVQDKNSFKIPTDNFDEIRENLLNYLLFETTNTSQFIKHEAELEHHPYKKAADNQPHHIAPQPKPTVASDRKEKFQSMIKQRVQAKMTAQKSKQDTEPASAPAQNDIITVSVPKTPQQNPRIRPKTMPHTMRLQDLIKNNASNPQEKTRDLVDLKSKLQGLLSKS